MALKPLLALAATCTANWTGPLLPGDARLRVPGVVGAVARADVARERPAAATREHLDDAADGIGAVEARRGSAQDLYPLDLVERNRLQGRGARRRRGEPQAIDQHQRLVAVGAAQEHAGHRTGTAVLHDLHARLALQEIGQSLRTRARDFLGSDHRDVGQHVADRLRLARGGHRHGGQRRGCRRIDRLREREIGGRGCAQNRGCAGNSMCTGSGKCDGHVARAGDDDRTCGCSAAAVQPRAAVASGSATIASRCAATRSRLADDGTPRTGNRPVSGLASLDRPPSRRVATVAKGRPALAYRCGGSRGLARSIDVRHRVPVSPAATNSRRTPVRAPMVPNSENDASALGHTVVIVRTRDPVRPPCSLNATAPSCRRTATSPRCRAEPSS